MDLSKKPIDTGVSIRALVSNTACGVCYVNEHQICILMELLTHLLDVSSAQNLEVEKLDCIVDVLLHSASKQNL
jgi:hypothetical protein